MLREELSLSQTFTIIINFLLGSAVVVGLGLNAKQDAWLVIVLGTVIGTVILSFYLYVLSLAPGKNLFEIMEICFSRPVSIVLTMIYSIYFFYIACRVIRDFGELITTALLPITPLEITIFSFMIVIAYIVYMGIEALGRVAEIFTPYRFIFLFFLVVFLYSGGNIHLERLLPIASNGFTQIVHDAFPSIFVFPYGELIAFMVILTNISNNKMMNRVSILALLVASFVLLITSILVITTLGVPILERSNFPLLNAARLVSIGEFIERIDTFIVLIMTFGIVIKSAVLIYGGLKGFEYIFHIPFRYFCIPVISVMTIFSVFIAIEISDHFTEGFGATVFFLHIPLEFVLPAIMTTVLLIKRSKQIDKKVGG